jgi:spore coat protein CotH
MSTSKHIDKLCAAALSLALLLTLLAVNGEALGIQGSSTAMGYESKLFDTDRVHTIDIVMDDWDGFLESCEDEEYTVCSVVIDNEAYKNVGLRAKGNTSLSSVSQLGSQRYSFKIEFDHYDSTKSYYGLDKLSLNNLIQDNTMLKDYLTYQMMGAFGVDAPLCSFVYITVNGEDWGLYLAVEGVEDAFLQRNYGSESGDLYKPDSMSMGGGGPGNGQDFHMDDFADQWGDQNQDLSEIAEQIQSALPEDFDPMTWMQENGGGVPDSDTVSEFLKDAGLDELAEQISDMDFGQGGGFTMGGGGFDGGMGSDDAKLQYIDDDPDSYSTIFDSAKTTVTQADQTRLIAALKALGEGDVASCLDVDEVLRYFVVHNYVVNGDSYTGSMVHNYYLYEQDGVLSMIPWDYNLAFGGFQSSSATDTVNDPIDNPLSVTGDGTRPMVDWIFQSEEYTELYHQYFQEFLDTVDIQGILSQAAALIDPYVESDPTKFCTYEEFQQGVETLKTFCQLRSESVSGQLGGSIPSTSQGQKTDSAALIDASAITISDMGSMNNTMGAMGGGGMAEAAGGFGGQGSGGKGDQRMRQMQWSGDGQTPGGSDASGGSDAFGGEVPELPTQDGEAEEMPAASFGETDSTAQLPQAAADTGGTAEPPTGAGEQMPQGAGGGDGQPQAPESGGGADEQPGGETAQQPQGEEADGVQPSQPDVGETTDETQQAPDGGQFQPDQAQPDGQPDATGPGQAGAQGGGETALLLGASVLVLLLGLAVALKFKH